MVVDVITQEISVIQTARTAISDIAIYVRSSQV